MKIEHEKHFSDSVTLINCLSVHNGQQPKAEKLSNKLALI